MKIGLISLGLAIAISQSVSEIANGQTPTEKPVAGTTYWRPAGPMPISDGPQKYSGQVGAIAIDPRDVNTVYIGTGAGGVWKSEDGGNNWRPLTDDQPVSAIGSLALDPSNPDTIYAGTGSWWHAGGGILKSIDAGATWTLLKGPFAGPPAPSKTNCAYAAGGAWIRSLAVHPSNANVLLAAAIPVAGVIRRDQGIFRSTDGSLSWTHVKSLPKAFTVIFHPTDANVAFAAGEGGIFKSTDTGLTWNSLNGTGQTALTIPAPDFGFNVALMQSKPNIMFAANVGTREMYRSSDAGQSWMRLKNDPPKECSGSLLAVDPVNGNVLFYGRQNLCRSTDGGANWANVMQGANGTKLHADMCAAAFSRDGAKLFIANDGGIWSATGPAATSLRWNNLNSTLATVLFYPNGLSVHPTNPDISIGGTQDNGELKYGGSIAWDYVGCGDGGNSVFDFSRPSNIYIICRNTGHILKSVSGGGPGSWVEKIAGIGPSDMSPTQEGLAIDPSNAQRLYYGLHHIYQSTDGAEHWRAVSPPVKGDIRILTVASSDSKTVWAGGTDGVEVTRNALSPNPTWANRTTGLPGRPVTQIAVSASDPATAYVTLSHYAIGGDAPGHVFKTVDAGATWIDSSGDLPDLPANDIVLDPDIADTFYLATDRGVFASANSGQSWSQLGTGLPRVPVYSLKLLRPSRILRAATFGRSAWDLSVNVPGASPVPPAEDCLRYNSDNLSIVTAKKKGATQYIVSDGPHWIFNYSTLPEATEAMLYMKHFNTVCYKGRRTPQVKKWFEKR